MVTLINGGWVGFIAILLGTAALIVSIVFAARDGWRRLGFDNTLFPVALLWMICRPNLSSGFQDRLPVALLLPGIDAGLFAAFAVTLVRDLLSVFSSDWRWRKLPYLYFCSLLAAGLSWGLYQDTHTYPSGWWPLAATEAIIILPFLLRLGSRVGD